MSLILPVNREPWPSFGHSFIRAAHPRMTNVSIATSLMHMYYTSLYVFFISWPPAGSVNSQSKPQGPGQFKDKFQISF